MPSGKRPGAAVSRGHASVWKVWLPIPILLLVLDWSFGVYFWHIPKLSRPDADLSYRFLLDVHELEKPRRSDTVRVLAFGSSVSRSFDPYQVRGLLEAADAPKPLDVTRLLVPGVKPSDYRIFFSTELPKIHPDVVVMPFNLVDFLNPSFERGLKPAVREVLPPLNLLRERSAAERSVAETLDLALASISNLYRYRTSIRIALEDHGLELLRWLRTPRPRGDYGVYADGYTKGRFGVAAKDGTGLDLEYYVDPEWIRQRGEVGLTFSMGGRVLTRRRETEPGWKTIELPSDKKGVVDVTADSTWNLRAGGLGTDTRLVGVRLRDTLPASANGSRPPYHYPPFDESQVPDYLRMEGKTGDDFMQKWNEVLESNTGFGKRFRGYREAKLRIRDLRFEPTGEYAAFEDLVRSFSESGASVVLVNTPESPLILKEYENTSYYRDYLAFLRSLAEKVPRVQFHDLRGALPAEDFNDWHHPNYMGAIKLGPMYAELVRNAIRERERREGTGT